jgi:short-subunit dehydrogenase
MELRGRTALLTGATGGLGRAIAEALAARGATLILSSRKPDELNELAASLPGDGHRVEPADLAEPGAALELVARTGDVDVLVANAGLPGTGLVEDLTPEDVQRALRVNLEAPILMCQAVVPGLRTRGGGHVVLIGSLNSKVATPRSALYVATKFGLRGFGLSLREDLRAHGIGVSVVMPGFIREAGMFAKSGAGEQGLGSATPQAVADGVVSAIERNRGEVHVASLRQRIGTALSVGRPELVGRMTNARATRAAEEVSSGQRGWH